MQYTKKPTENIWVYAVYKALETKITFPKKQNCFNGTNLQN